MFKWIRRLFFLVIALAAAGFSAIVLGRNSVGVWMTRNAIEHATGFSVTIGSLDIQLTRPRLIAKDIIIHNPKGAYKEPLAMKIQRLDAVYDPLSFLRGEPHLRKLAIDISEVKAVKNAQGELNLKRLQGSSPSNPNPDADDRFRIDELAISLGTVVCLDEGRGMTRPKTYKVNAKNRVYRNIQRRAEIKKLVLNLLVESLPRNLLGLTVETLDRGIKNVADTLEKGAKSLLNIFGAEKSDSSEEPRNPP
ncbi:MAG: hypothetical protein HY360_05620 [Verrucomicrobia bacterium]|nr:hypothetical protein [Verrucomicrobiota bacterium]